MGEALKKLFDKIYSSYPAEDEEELGEDTHTDGESDETYAISSPNDELPSSPSTCLNSDNLLYHFSSHVEQLPLNKGLSKYYEGKSQSFTSFSKVQSLEDLPKKEKEIAYTRKMKTCKSYSVFDEDHLLVTSSSETISKSIQNKASPPMPSCGSSMERSSSSGFLIRGSRPPPVPVNKHK